MHVLLGCVRERFFRCVMKGCHAVAQMRSVTSLGRLIVAWKHVTQNGMKVYSAEFDVAPFDKDQVRRSKPDAEKSPPPL